MGIACKRLIIISALCLVLSGCEAIKQTNAQNRYRDLCFLGADATDTQQYDVAITNFLAAQSSGVIKDKAWFHRYRNGLRDCYRAQGRFSEAIRAGDMIDAYKVNFSELPEQSQYVRQTDIQYCYLDMAKIYLEWGKYEEARENLDASVEGRDMSHWDEGDILYHAPTFSLFYTETGDFNKAIDSIKMSMPKLRQGKLEIDLLPLRYSLATAYYNAGEYAKAEEQLSSACRMVNGLFTIGLMVEDVGKSVALMGQIAASKNENEQALNYYNIALKVLHVDLAEGERRLKEWRDTYGSHSSHNYVWRTQESDILNLIGQLHIKQNKPAESQKAYKEALRLRRETATATHPNCANSLKGLADVAAYRNELTSASLLATQALAVLDNSVVPTHPRTASVLIALTAIRAMSEEKTAASESTPTSPSLSTASLNARLDTIPQKPLGPWKEDFLDTASFYAQLLKKSGKQAEAARLEQIAAERKGKN